MSQNLITELVATWRDCAKKSLGFKESGQHVNISVCTKGSVITWFTTPQVCARCV